MKLYYPMSAEQTKANSVEGGFTPNHYVCEVTYQEGGYNRRKGIYTTFRNVVSGEGMFESTMLMDSSNFSILSLELTRKNKKKLERVEKFVKDNQDKIFHYQITKNKTAIHEMMLAEFSE